MRRSPVLLALAATAFATPVLAQSLTAPLGTAVRIPIRGVASDVVVGDTKVADVTVVGPSALFVSGRGYGSTNVVVMDAGGRTLFNGRVTVPMSTPGQVTVYRGRESGAVFCAPLCDTANGGALSAAQVADAAPASPPAAFSAPIPVPVPVPAAPSAVAAPVVNSNAG
jgi:hypothetical protein